MLPASLPLVSAHMQLTSASAPRGFSAARRARPLPNWYDGHMPSLSPLCLTSCWPPLHLGASAGPRFLFSHCSQLNWMPLARLSPVRLLSLLSVFNGIATASPRHILVRLSLIRRQMPTLWHRVQQQWLEALIINLFSAYIRSRSRLILVRQPAPNIAPPVSPCLQTDKLHASRLVAVRGTGYRGDIGSPFSRHICTTMATHGPIPYSRAAR